MKRFFALLFLFLCLAAPCLAAGKVVDNADLLSYQEESALNQRIRQIEQEYQLPVILYTTDSIGYSAVNQYAANAFEKYVGREKDGLLFLLNMGERDYFTLTSGKAIDAFTDWGLDALHETVVPYLSRGSYAQAFTRYLDQVEKYMDRYESGDPYDVPGSYSPYVSYAPKTPQERFREYLPVVWIAALVIALIVVLCMRARMKTVHRKGGASSYVRDFELTRVQDIFLYSTTTRRKIETSSSTGGRGGSTTFRSSSGGHYGGRGGKF